MRPHLGALLSVFLVGATPQDEPFTPVGVHPITSFEGLVATGSAASAPASPKAKPSPIHVSLETSSSGTLGIHEDVVRWSADRGHHRRFRHQLNCQ